MFFFLLDFLVAAFLAVVVSVTVKLAVSAASFILTACPVIFSVVVVFSVAYLLFEHAEAVAVA